MIFQKKRWVLKENEGIQFSEIEIHNLRLKPQIVNILNNRNIKTKEQIEKFLFPTIQHFHDPYLLNDMQKAVELIIKTIKEGNKILIYGDYDCDGVTSTYVLYHNLLKYANVSYFIPNRFTDGYGLNIEILKQKLNDFDLLITVDCGISSINEVDFLKSQDKAVIITDHHEPKGKIPGADAVINPKRHDSTYPFRDLAGVGVAFKLLHALKLKGYNFILSNYFDIISIGTIGDIMPLLDENRIIAKYGLKKLMNTNNVGLKALMEVAGLKMKQELKTSDISYIIVPRLNAAGRITDAKMALELLLEEDEKKALEIAMYLDEENRKRQQIEEKTIREAQEKLKLNKDKLKKKIFILGDKLWHPGVVGIASSKIAERFYRPTILFTELEENIAKASGRSIKGFNLFKALQDCEDVLIKFGGHEGAAGLSFSLSNLDEFENRLNEIAQSMNIFTFKPYLEIDCELNLNQIDDELIDQLSLLEPFGVGNPEPTFLIKNVIVDSFRFLNNGEKYYKFSICNTNIEAICFENTNESNEFAMLKKVDIVGKLSKNIYNSQRRNQINIVDIRENINDGCFKDFMSNIMYLSKCEKIKNIEHIDKIKWDNIPKDKKSVIISFYYDIMKMWWGFLDSKIKDELFSFFNDNERIIKHQSAPSELFFDDLLVTKVEKLKQFEEIVDIAIACDMPSYIVAKNQLNIPVYYFDMGIYMGEIKLNREEFINVYNGLKNIGFIPYDFSGINDMDNNKKMIKILIIAAIFVEAGLFELEFTYHGVNQLKILDVGKKVNLKETCVHKMVELILEMEGFVRANKH